jgi:hypothetical protein
MFINRIRRSYYVKDKLRSVPCNLVYRFLFVLSLGTTGFCQWSTGPLTKPYLLFRFAGVVQNRQAVI